MTLPHEIERQLLTTWPAEVWRETRILLAVSGGADSVAMLCACVRLASDPKLIEVAHFNHGWRGTESDEDERFVVDLCATLNVRIAVERADMLDGTEPDRTEENARAARYRFLTSTAYALGARYVLTAHTADDRVETLLHNLFRGTGLAGIRSIGVTRPLDQDLVLARPLIHCSRRQVFDFLNHLQQDFREDSSNQEESFRRNFIRRSVLPLVRQQYGPHTDAKLLTFSEHAAELDQMLSRMAADFLAQAEVLAREALDQGLIAALNRSMFALPKSVALDAHWPVVQQALNFVWLDRRWPLKNMTRDHWNAIREVYSTASEVAEYHTSLSLMRAGRWIAHDNLPGNLRLEASDSWILIRAI